MVQGFFDRFFQRRIADDGNIDELANQLSFRYAQIDQYLFEKSLIASPHQEVLNTYFLDCASRDINKKITLEEEITLLNQYINLQQVTSDGQMAHVDLKTEISAAPMDIHPFILYPLVQNAFRSACFNTSRSPIRVSIRLIETTLMIEVSNRINPYLDNQGNTEIMNLYKRRLKFNYIDKYDLFINSNSNVHKVTLRLILSP